MNKRRRIRNEILSSFEHWHAHKGKPVAEVPMPEPLKKFPLWNGFVIHHTVFQDSNGTPDFRVAEETNRKICIFNDRCSLCGELLGEVSALIGGERSIQSRYFIDPAAHPDCAYYAALTCPFLALSARKMAPIESISEKMRSMGADAIATVDQNRPKRMGLLLCSGQTPCAIRESGREMIVVQANDALAIDWEIMPISKGA